MPKKQRISIGYQAKNLVRGLNKPLRIKSVDPCVKFFTFGRKVKENTVGFFH